jgi:hypothetical protein
MVRIGFHRCIGGQMESREDSTHQFLVPQNAAVEVERIPSRPSIEHRPATGVFFIFALCRNSALILKLLPVMLVIVRIILELAPIFAIVERAACNEQPILHQKDDPELGYSCRLLLHARTEIRPSRWPRQNRLLPHQSDQPIH